jgi:hypothetical protein
MESDSLDRREFTVQSALALLGGVTITITGCGGGNSMTGSSGGNSSPNAVGAISDNHGHSAVISSAQLTAGNGMSLNIQDAADHPHMVDLTGTEITQIRNGQTVVKASTSTASAAYSMHSHTVSFARSNAPSGPGY